MLLNLKDLATKGLEATIVYDPFIGTGKVPRDRPVESIIITLIKGDVKIPNLSSAQCDDLKQLGMSNTEIDNVVTDIYFKLESSLIKARLFGGDRHA